MQITEKSRELFVAYAKDAGNWSGTPLVGGNVGSDKHDRGNLTQLKRAGLVTTFLEPSDRTLWIDFTLAGREYAATLGLIWSGHGFNNATK